MGLLLLFGGVGTPAPAAEAFPYIDLIPSFDVDLVVNDWRGARTGGETQVAVDEDSRREFFLRSKQVESLVTTDSEVLSQLQYKRGQFAQPLNRIDQITIQPLVDPADIGYIDAGLSREVGDKITVRETSPGFAAEQRNDYVIQNIRGEITPGPLNSLKLTFGLWPAAASSFWVAGDPDLSLAGVSTKPGY